MKGPVCANSGNMLMAGSLYSNAIFAVVAATVAGALCCARPISLDLPKPIVPFGLFCQSSPLLRPLEQIIQCGRVRGDFRHLQAVPGSKSILFRRIRRHRDTSLREPRLMRTQPAPDFGCSLVATKNFKMKCPSELEHYGNLCPR